MKSRKTRARGSSGMRNQQARREIRNFLRALDTYPESSSRRPDMSFEQHQRSVATSAKAPVQRGINGN